MLHLVDDAEEKLRKEEESVEDELSELQAVLNEKFARLRRLRKQRRELRSRSDQVSQEVQAELGDDDVGDEVESDVVTGT